MDKQKTLRDIVLMPKKINQLNKSIFSLLMESGYFEIYNKVHVGDFIKFLERHPENIEEWLALSEDKRTNTGWYFKKNTQEKYTVGYFSIDHDDSLQKEYQDAVEACANFIKLEIEDIRQN